MSGAEAPFAERLRRLRESAGLTQEELASRAGLTAKAVSALERGERKRPYPHTVRSLADALALTDAERADLQAATPRRGAHPPPPPPPAPRVPPRPPGASRTRSGRLSSPRSRAGGPSRPPPRRPPRRFRSLRFR